MISGFVPMYRYVDLSRLACEDGERHFDNLVRFWRKIGLIWLEE